MALVLLAAVVMGGLLAAMAAGPVSMSDLHALITYPTSDNDTDEFQAAVATGDVNAVKSLLARKPGLVNSRDNDNWTPLHEAARVGAVNMAQILLANGADINARNNKGCSPLHTAVCAKEFAITKYLVKHGADINAEDYEGITPLAYARRYHNAQTIDLLYSHGAIIDLSEAETL